MKTSPSPTSSYAPLLEKVGGVLAITAAIAFGTARLLEAARKDEAEDEMDTTDYLLRTEASRRRLLAAVERDQNRQLIAQKRT